MSIKCNLQVLVYWWNQTNTFGESQHPQNFFFWATFQLKKLSSFISCLSFRKRRTIKRDMKLVGKVGIKVLSLLVSFFAKLAHRKFWSSRPEVPLAAGWPSRVSAFTSGGSPEVLVRIGSSGPGPEVPAGEFLRTVSRLSLHFWWLTGSSGTDRKFRFRTESLRCKFSAERLVFRFSLPVSEQKFQCACTGTFC